MKGRVLIVAGSDSGGGAGIQADIKTATLFGVYAMTAVTAVTVQNTRGIRGVQLMPVKLVADQIAVGDVGHPSPYSARPGAGIAAREPVAVTEI